MKEIQNQQDTTIYEYDHNNNIIKKIFKNGTIWQYKYDKNNNCTKLSDSHGNFCMYEYDQNNNLIKENHNGNTTSFEYDENKNMIKQILPRGDTWSATLGTTLSFNAV